MKLLKLTIKTVYGNELIYPDDQASRLFAQLIGKKTFSENDLRIIKSLGFAITFEPIYIHTN